MHLNDLKREGIEFDEANILQEFEQKLEGLFQQSIPVKKSTTPLVEDYSL